MNRILVIFLLIWSSQVLAFRYAYTTNLKTIVYADKNLDIPIGYIRSGRKIKVADRSLKNNTIVPMVVTGRIVFVKTEDITFKLEGENVLGGPEIKDHNVELLFMTDQEKLSNNVYVSTSITTISSGDSWQSFNNKLGVDSSSFTMINVGIAHRMPDKRSGFGFDINYIYSSTEKAEIRTLTASGEYQYKFFETSLLSLEAYLGLHLSGDIEIKTSAGQQGKGVLYGTMFGGRIRFFPYSKINFFGHAGITSIKPRSMDIIEIDGVRTVVDDFGGTSIGAGVAWRL
jgi:hypothetical protein